MTSVVGYANTAWDVVVDFFEAVMIAPMWEWGLKNPLSQAIGGLSGILWTVMAWNLLWLFVFWWAGSRSRIMWLLFLVPYIFCTFGLFVVSRTTSSAVSSARSVPSTQWIDDQGMFWWSFVFLALFLVVIVGIYTYRIISAVAWVAYAGLIVVVMISESAIYSREPSITAICLVAALLVVWCSLNGYKTAKGSGK